MYLKTTDRRLRCRILPCLLGAALILAAGLSASASAAAQTSPPAAPRIIGGQAASPGTFPWLAFVVYDFGDGTYGICSGTVVSQNLVLTAAHCAGDETTGAPFDPSGYAVTTGELDLSQKGGQTSQVSRVILNPSWSPSTGQDDAALLQLSEPITAPAIDIATDPGDLGLLDPGTNAYIAGWGRTDPSTEEIPSQLQYAPTVVQSPQYCASELGDGFDASNQTCAIDSPSYTTGTCNGDSGGPLAVQRSDGTWVEIGVTNFGFAVGDDECLTGEPDYFTRVDAISAWLNSTIAALGPPIVDHAAASAVTLDGAHLSADVNPNGVTGTGYFEYGTTSAYGTSTPTLTFGAGNTSVPESATLTALRAATTYHFRFVAASANGITDGPDATFTTPSPPPVRPLAGAYAGRTHQGQPISLTVAGTRRALQALAFGVTLRCTRRTSPLHYRLGPLSHTKRPWALTRSHGFGFRDSYRDAQGRRYLITGTFNPGGVVTGTLSVVWNTSTLGSCRSGTVGWRATRVG